MTCTLTSTAASIVLFTACSLLFTSAFTRLAVSLALVACFICPLCCNRRCNDPLVTARTFLRTSPISDGYALSDGEGGELSSHPFRPRLTLQPSP